MFYNRKGIVASLEIVNVVSQATAKEMALLRCLHLIIYNMQLSLFCEIIHGV